MNLQTHLHKMDESRDAGGNAGPVSHACPRVPGNCRVLLMAASEREKQYPQRHEHSVPDWANRLNQGTTPPATEKRTLMRV
jgi:hypothetical protein